MPERNMRSLVSIIIINFNNVKLSVDCIKSVVTSTNDVAYEIIVIDNASTSGDCDILKREFPFIELIKNKENLGFAKAVNQGIRVAKGGHILLLNNDVLVAIGCLDKIFAFANSNKDVGLVGCKVLNRDGSIQYSCAHYPTVLTEVFFFTIKIVKGIFDPADYYKYMKYWNYGDTRKVDCISGCFMWVKREVFEKVGLLDEDFFMYYEDSEFCKRVSTISDFKVYFYPNAVITHFHKASSEPADFISLRRCFTSALYYIMKVYGKRQERLFKYTCRLLWQVEAGILFLFKFSDKVNKKYEMITELLKVST